MIVLFSVLIIISAYVFAGPDDEGPKGGESEKYSADEQELLDELQNDFGISASDVSSGSISKDGSGNIVVTSGSLQDSAGASCSAPCRVDSSGKIRDAKVLSDGGLSGSGVMGYNRDAGVKSVDSAQQITQGGNRFDLVTGGSFSDNGDFRVAMVGSASVGTARVLRGENVVFSGGVLSMGKAQSYADAPSKRAVFDVVNGDIVGTKIVVEKASRVDLDCAVAENVENSEFVIGKDVVSVSSDGGEVFNLRDCAYNDVVYESLNDNNSLVMSKGGASVSYTLRDTKISHTRNNFNFSGWLWNFSESVSAFNESSFDLFDAFAVGCMSLAPGSFYEVSFNNDQATYYKVVSGNRSQLLCSKKSADFRVPCADCSILNFVDKSVEMRGWWDVIRYFFNRDRIALLPSSFFVSHGGIAQFSLDEKFELFRNVSVQSDVPEYVFHASTFLDVIERKVSAATHRFVGVDASESVADYSFSFFSKYVTVYSPAEMTIENNHLVYDRGSLHVEVLPKGNNIITQLKNDLQKDQEEFVLVSGMIVSGLLFLFLHPKKSQVTMFILMGMVILVIVGVAVFLVALVNGGSLSRSGIDAGSVDGHVYACLGDAAQRALITAGARGGRTVLLSDFQESLGTNYARVGTSDKQVSDDVLVAELGAYVDAAMVKCMNPARVDLGAQFREISPPKTAVVIGGKAVRFDMQYEFEVKKNDVIKLYAGKDAGFSTTVNVRLKDMLGMRNAIVQSQINNNGFIDVDALEGDNFNVYVWPEGDELITLIKDTQYAASQRKFNFVFATR